MLLITGILIFLIGCIVSSVDDSNASAQRREAQRQAELMRILSENQKKEVSYQQTKVTRRRIAQDKEGNILAEEITEETV